MIIIDSSLWLEYFVDSKNAKIIEDLIKEAQKIIVPSIILTEIYKKLLKEWDESIARDYISQFQDYIIVELDFQNAIRAASIGLAHHLPLADSIIYAAALDNNAILYTMDKHFKGLPNVEYFEKK